jgi:M6 family metalloprotease-like protein
VLSAVLPLLATFLVATASPAQAAPADSCKLPGPSGWAEREHPGLITNYTERWRDPLGTHRGIALFVDFSDAVGTEPARQSLVSDFAPAGDWYGSSSYGRTDLDITWDTQWHRMPHPSGYYHNYNPATGVASTFALHRQFMQGAVAVADPQVDFSGYDFVYVIVPPALHNSNFRSGAYIAYESFPSDHMHSAEGSIRLGASLGWGSDQKHRLLVHETSHLFGLPDLYNYTVSEDANLAAIGGWDLMGALWGSAPDHLAWHKWKMAWLDDWQVYCMDAPSQQTHTLTPLHTTGGEKMVVVRTGPNRAVVAEYRAAGGPIDGVAGQVVSPGCFRSGVLVYTVDADKVGGQDPVEVLDANPWTDTGSGCDSTLRSKDDATLVYPYQEVTDPVSGVKVQLTGIGSGTRTVQVTRP